MSRAVVVLGSTGSIGESALDVIRRHPDRLRVHALTAYANTRRLAAQCREFRPPFAVVADEQRRGELADLLAPGHGGTAVLGGATALERVVTDPQAQVVITGIVGASGLLSTLAAVRAGKTVLIANKEPLVMAGTLIVAEARASGATILPLDSEHNAVFQCLPDRFRVTGSPDNGSLLPALGIRRIVLTASGGPFRRTPLDELSRVTPEQAAAHPNWTMGRKISIDSATMMNKGLELIEACALYSLSPDRVDIVVHPQSAVHSLVSYVDGSILAQLGSADMRIPIAHALAWPERLESGAAELDLCALGRLEFERPDEARFPCLRLARRAAEAGGTVPAVLNAANEVAVEAFCERRIRFTDIPRIIEWSLERAAPEPCERIDDSLRADRLGRELSAAAAAALAAGKTLRRLTAG